DPGRAGELAIGGGDAPPHRGRHDVGPGQHLDLRLDARAAVQVGDLPSGGPARPQVQPIAADPRLFGTLLAVELTVSAGRKRVVSGDVEHPPPSDPVCPSRPAGPRPRCFAWMLADGKGETRAGGGSAGMDQRSCPAITPPAARPSWRETSVKAASKPAKSARFKAWPSSVREKAR